MIRRSWRLVRKVAALVLAIAIGGMVVATPAASHDVPDEIVMDAFVKPERERLHFLVRIPLAMLLNIGLPKRGPGYIDLALVDEGLERAAAAAARELVLYENGAPLLADATRARISQPSEETFGSYQEAAAHIAGLPLPDTANVFWNQGYFDLHLEYPITSEDSGFALDMLVGAALSSRTKLSVQFLPPDRTARVYEVHGGHGWLELDPSWYHTAWTFMGLGFQYILHNLEQLLFLFCLVLPFRTRQPWALLGVITAFTAAHALTLSAAAGGLMPAGTWFPPLIETLIVLSILYLAVANILIVWLGGDAAANLGWRWVVAGAFGLIHGFGSSFVLQHDLQLAGAHRAVSLLAFSAGVGLAQLALVLVTMPALAVALRRPRARRAGIIILSALLAHTAWNWTLENVAALRFVRWPTLEGATLGWLLAGLTLVALLGIALWRAQRPPAAPSDAAVEGAAGGHQGADLPRHGARV